MPHSAVLSVDVVSRDPDPGCTSGLWGHRTFSDFASIKSSLVPQRIPSRVFGDGGLRFQLFVFCDTVFFPPYSPECLVLHQELCVHDPVHFHKRRCEYWVIFLNNARMSNVPGGNLTSEKSRTPSHPICLLGCPREAANASDGSYPVALNFRINNLRIRGDKYANRCILFARVTKFAAG